MKQRGTVRVWKDSFGFILADMPSLGEVYLHISDLGSFTAELIKQGDRLEFDVAQNDQHVKTRTRARAAYRAVNVEPIVGSEDLSDSGP